MGVVGGKKIGVVGGKEMGVVSGKKLGVVGTVVVYCIVNSDLWWQMLWCGRWVVRGVGGVGGEGRGWCGVWAVRGVVWAVGGGAGSKKNLTPNSIVIKTNEK